MMADMVSAPEGYIVPDADEGLNRIVLEDERMLPQLHIRPDERPAAHITGQPIALLLCRTRERRAHPVQFDKADGHEHIAFRRRAHVLKPFERHHIKSKQLVLGTVLLLQAKG